MSGFRELLHKNKSVVVAVLIVVIAGVWWTALQPSGRSPHGQAYYLDLQTNKLFSAADVQLPPIPAPSGGEGVLANVYTCGQCANESSRFIGYLEKYSDAYKQALGGDQDMPDDIAYHGEMFGTPDGQTWLPKAGAQGQALVMALASRCDGKTITPCLP